MRMSPRHTAKFLRVTSRTPEGEQRLWVGSDGKYVLTSSVCMGYIEETAAFYSDEQGRIVDYSELAMTAPNMHERCLKHAGYTAVYPEEVDL